MTLKNTVEEVKNKQPSGLPIMPEEDVLSDLAAKAEAGDAEAQNSLGLMYHKGEGVLQDYVQAHKWWNIAAANGYEDARINRDLIGKEMTPEQIAEAQRLAREWTEAHHIVNK